MLGLLAYQYKIPPFRQTASRYSRHLLISLHPTAMRESRSNGQVFRYMWVSRCTRFYLAYKLHLFESNPGRLDVPIRIAMVAMMDGEQARVFLRSMRDAGDHDTRALLMLAGSPRTA